MSKKRLALLGSGFLSGIVCDAYCKGILAEYEMVGILGRNAETSGKLAAQTGAKACTSLEELLETKPDIVAEAASVALVKECAVPILSKGIGFVVLSIGAFADTVFYEEAKQTAVDHDAKIYIASGAIGGFDVLRTIALMEAYAPHDAYQTGITTRKGPKSLQNTPLFEDHLLTDTEDSHVFEGNAEKAISLLPTKVNVAVACSLASKGPKNTSVNIFSVPGFVGDDHCIVSETEGIKATVDIYSSTSAIAGWSIVAVLQNIVSPVVF
ncbi:MAG: DUF108 domain-containing protein [Lachnospiraceae bacterium]|nr:DUF108 domain-containing protein [Lachnospiraceae bacterium]